MLRTLLIPAFLAGLFAAGTGCEVFNDDDDEVKVRRDRDRVSRRDTYNDTYRDRTRDTTYDRVDRRTDDAVLSGSGTTGRGLDRIPRRAERVDAAQGTSELTYAARRDGTIYVYDVDADQLVYTGTLRDGQRFVLDPDDNLAEIDGRKVLDRDLKSSHRFRLYFAEDSLRN